MSLHGPDVKAPQQLGNRHGSGCQHSRPQLLFRLPLLQRIHGCQNHRKQCPGVLGQHQHSADCQNPGTVQEIFFLFPNHQTDPGAGGDTNKGIDENIVIIVVIKQPRKTEYPQRKQPIAQPVPANPGAHGHNQAQGKYTVSVVAHPLYQRVSRLPVFQLLQEVLKQGHGWWIAGIQGVSGRVGAKDIQIAQNPDSISPVGKFVITIEELSVDTDDVHQVEGQKQRESGGEHILQKHPSGFLLSHPEGGKHIQPGTGSADHSRTQLQKAENTEQEHGQHHGAAGQGQNLLILSLPPGGGIDTAGGNAEEKQNNSHGGSFLGGEYGKLEFSEFKGPLV